MPSRFFLPIFAPWILVASATAQAPTCNLVQDIYATLDASADSNPAADLASPGDVQSASGFLECNGRWYFTTLVNEAVRLHVTDGTAAGTIELATFEWLDDFGGNDGCSDLICCNGMVFFAASDGVHGVELWTTDGTPAGTVQVLDIHSGSNSSSPAEFVCYGGQLVFVAEDGAYGRELWTSDGTAAGTRLLVDVRSGMDSSNPRYLNLTPSQNELIFQADDGVHGSEPWISDGTLTGTWMLLDIFPGSASSQASMFRSFAGETVFVASEPTYGRELWVTDGTTTGTRLLFDIATGIDNSHPQLWTVGDLGTELLFFARNDTWGNELWKTDGTTAGTVLVADIRPGIDGSNGANLVAANGRVYFAAEDGTHGTELWCSDGTTAGTHLVMDIHGGTGASYPGVGFEFGGRYLFAAHDGNSEELWSTDGTTAGTLLAVDLESGSSSSPREFTPISSTHFLANLSTQATGSELFLSDGTTAGTQLVVDLGVVAGSSEPREMHVAFGDRVYLAATDGSTGREPWILEAGSAHLLADLNPGVGDSQPSYFTSFWLGGRVLTFFAANDGTHGAEPWVTDGSAAGTVALGDLNPGLAGSVPYDFTACGENLVLFRAEDGSTARLFASDGTAAGTYMIPGVDWLGRLTSFDGKVVFSGSRGLWISDGTVAGTYRVAGPGASGPTIPNQFHVHGGVLYFAAYDDTHGMELWTSDGTAAGTTLLADLNPGTPGSSPSQFLSMGGHLVFTARDEVFGTELWTTDGTAAGTTRLLDIEPNGGSNPYELTLALDGGRFFFTGYRALDGDELWVSDGTAAGTVLVTDLEPGTRGSGPTGLVAAGDGVYFLAGTRSTGSEVWFSDGTAAGTRLVCDLRPGNLSSRPWDLTVFGGSVLFGAWTEATGDELFAVQGVGTVEVLGTQPRRRTSVALEASAPLLGETLEIRWRDAPANQLGGLFLDVPLPVYTLPFFADGAYAVFLPTSLVWTISPGPVGSLGIPIPNAAEFLGLSVQTQSLWLDPNAPLPLELTEALRITAGR